MQPYATFKVSPVSSLKTLQANLNEFNGIEISKRIQSTKAKHKMLRRSIRTTSFLTRRTLPLLKLTSALLDLVGTPDKMTAVCHSGQSPYPNQVGLLENENP